MKGQNLGKDCASDQLGKLLGGLQGFGAIGGCNLVRAHRRGSVANGQNILLGGRYVGREWGKLWTEKWSAQLSLGNSLNRPVNKGPVSLQFLQGFSG
jgi:hypothetical protein